MTATDGCTSAMLWRHFARTAEAIGAGVQFAETGSVLLAETDADRGACVDRLRQLVQVRREG